MKKNRTSGLWVAALACLLCGCGTTARQTSQENNSKNFTFAYFTDVHLNKSNQGNGDEGLRTALSDAQKQHVDFILFGGDNADTDKLGNAEQTADSLHARFKSIVDESSVPVHFTIGNHDRYYRCEGKRDSLGFKLFEKRFGKTYYSFDHKGVHFIVLNSLHPCKKGPYSVDAAQMKWLKEDLQKTGKETPVVVSIHVPMLSLYYPVVDGILRGADMIENTKEVVDALMPYNVKLVLQGHQHIYEQIQERSRWFVTAGAISANWWKGPLQETEEGYLLIHVDKDDNFTWEYVDYHWQAEKSK